MKSNRSEPGNPERRPDEAGGPDALPSENVPPRLAALLDRSRARLGSLASTLHYFPTIGSTNDVAATLAEGAVVLAETQTAGRGRRGHSWFSPPGGGLYASVVLAPGRARTDPVRATLLLTLAAGVALTEALAEATGLRADLKWPNDLYVSRRKVAGILAEASAERVVLGYGINVAASAYPPDLGDRVTSIESELGSAVDRDRLFVETLAALWRRYDDLSNGRFDAILDAWRRRAPAAIGARVAWTRGGIIESGVTAGIDDRGALLVRIADRTERIVSGELTWL